MKSTLRLAMILIGCAIAPSAQALEIETHIGLTESAVLASHLHGALVAEGLPLGLYEPLTMIPPRAVDDRVLFAELALLDAADAPRPIGRKTTAVAWLAAGSALERLDLLRGRIRSDEMRRRELDVAFARARVIAKALAGADAAARSDANARVFLILGRILCEAQLSAGLPQDARLDAFFSRAFGRAGVPAARASLLSASELRDHLAAIITDDESDRHGREILGHLSRLGATLLDERIPSSKTAESGASSVEPK